MTDPTAALVVIGDEILSGKVEDANARYLIGELRVRGVALRRVWFVPDDLDEIAFAVRHAADRFDHVFTSGGVGPTHDDLTFEGVGRAFDRPLARHPEIARAIDDYFGHRTSEVLRKMADVPEGSELIEIVGDLVPLVRVANVNVLPGIPALFRQCFERLAGAIGGRPFHLVRLYTPLDEGQIADHLRETQAAHDGLAIGSYPRYDRDDYRVLITIESRDPAVVASAEAELRSRIGSQDLVEPATRP